MGDGDYLPRVLITGLGCVHGFRENRKKSTADMYISGGHLGKQELHQSSHSAQNHPLLFHFATLR
jgi:hypothetical protein